MFKILIVEDDIDILQAMKSVLVTNKFEVETASNLEEGLAKLKSFNPNLIFLDIMMDTPVDGFSFTYRIRSNDENSEFKNWKDIPIVAISSINKELNFNYSSKTDSNFTQFNEFIEKPIAPEKLIEIAKKYEQLNKK